MGQREAECAAARRCSTGGAKESGLGAPGGREKSTCAANVVVDHLPCHVAAIRTGLAGEAWDRHTGHSSSCGLSNYPNTAQRLLDLSVSVHKAHTCRRPRRTGGTDEATYQQPWAGLRGAGARRGARRGQHLRHAPCRGHDAGTTAATMTYRTEPARVLAVQAPVAFYLQTSQNF